MSCLVNLKFATSRSMFRARLPSVFITSHKMPRLPRNLHLVTCHHLTQPWQCDSQKNPQHDTSKVLCLPRKSTQNDDGHVQSAAPATKTATHLLKTSQNYCACHTKRLSTRYETRLTVTKCHICHAKRSNATCETSKSDPFCTPYHGHGHTALTRTVADGCATSSEHTLNPQTPRVKREPLLRIREEPWSINHLYTIVEMHIQVLS